MKKLLVAVVLVFGVFASRNAPTKEGIKCVGSVLYKGVESTLNGRKLPKGVTASEKFKAIQLSVSDSVNIALPATLAAIWDCKLGIALYNDNGVGGRLLGCKPIGVEGMIMTRVVVDADPVTLTVAGKTYDDSALIVAVCK